MSKAKIELSPQKTVRLYERDASNVFQISEDKLRLKLIALEKSIESKTTIFCYIGLTVTLLVTLLTATFQKNFLSISKEIWSAIFVVFFFFCLGMSVKKISDHSNHKKTINDIIEDIKEEK